DRFFGIENPRDNSVSPSIGTSTSPLNCSQSISVCLYIDIKERTTTLSWQPTILISWALAQTSANRVALELKTSPQSVGFKAETAARLTTSCGGTGNGRTVSLPNSPMIVTKQRTSSPTRLSGFSDRLTGFEGRARSQAGF